MPNQDNQGNQNQGQNPGTQKQGGQDWNQDKNKTGQPNNGTDMPNKTGTDQGTTPTGTKGQYTEDEA